MSGRVPVSMCEKGEKRRGRGHLVVACDVSPRLVHAAHHCTTTHVATAPACTVPTGIRLFWASVGAILATATAPGFSCQRMFTLSPPGGLLWPGKCTRVSHRCTSWVAHVPMAIGSARLPTCPSDPDDNYAFASSQDVHTDRVQGRVGSDARARAYVCVKLSVSTVDAVLVDILMRVSC